MGIIETKIIPHNEQRYNTVGDYIEQDGKIVVMTSELGHEDMNFLLSLHEVIEAYLCRKHDICFQAIDDFDKNFTGEGEPGDSEQAPYHLEHLFAEIIERRVAMELGVNWSAYEAKIKEVSDTYGR
jgi:hypothetical protein